MKLHLSRAGTRNSITGYGERHVLVNGQREAASVIVLGERILPWQAVRFDELAAQDFEIFHGLDLEIVLLGTGPRQRFPHPRLTAGLAAAGIGLEVMSLQAACRTYNILIAEERRVAAALLFE